jgi:hypothetical protein
MTAQQTFEELLANEGKLNQYASLSEMGALPQERLGIVETLIVCSEKDRLLVDSLLIAFEAMPEAYRPVIQNFEELKRQMLRREDGWKKLRHQPKKGGTLPESAMNTVAWLCCRVDEPLQAIIADLQGLAAASAIEAFARWVGEPNPLPYCEWPACTNSKGLEVRKVSDQWRTLCLMHGLEAIESPGYAVEVFKKKDEADGSFNEKLAEVTKACPRCAVELVESQCPGCGYILPKSPR